MSFDATDLEIARREHAYEMGEDSPSDHAWYCFCAAVEKLMVQAGLGDDLDGNDAVDGYSLDVACDRFARGDTPEEYMTEIGLKRACGGERS